jgi:hypothetical protein
LDLGIISEEILKARGIDIGGLHPSWTSVLHIKYIAKTIAFSHYSKKGKFLKKLINFALISINDSRRFKLIPAA